MRQYRDIFIGRSREAARDLKIEWPSGPNSYPTKLTPIALARWFVYSKANTVSPATFRIYRASISWGISQFFMSTETASEALAMLAASKATKKSEITEEHGVRTSASKSKGLTKQRFELLKEIGMKRKHLSMAPVALHFLQATLITGLRPAEWISTQIVRLDGQEDDLFRFGVRTKTIKQGAGDTSAMDTKLPYRTIPVPLFSDTTDSEIASVEACIAYASKIRVHAERLNLKDEEYAEVVGMIWSQKVTKMGRAIRMLSNECNLNHCAKADREATTLYSARHQFKTDASKLLKKTIGSQKSVAYVVSALMGHNNPDTQKGYGIISTANYDDDSNQTIFLSSDLTEQAKYLANIIQNT